VSLIFRTRGERSPQNDLIGRDTVHAERITQRKFVLSECAGLVRAQHIHASQFLNGRQAVTMASFFASRRAPTAIVTDSTVGIATGIAATRSTGRSACGDFVASEERNHQDQHNSATARTIR